MADVTGTNATSVAQDRPAPTVPSLLGGVAALLLVVSLFAFLAEIDGDHRRLMGLLLSIGFEVIGVGILWLSRDRRMISVGHGLTAIGLLPLVFHLFVDPADPGKNINSVGDFTGTATAALVVLALLWGAAYVIGPGRRYGVYLAGSLLAIWLVAIVQIVDDPLTQVSEELSPFSSGQTFTPIDRYDDPAFGGPYDDLGASDDGFSDDYLFDDPQSIGPTDDFEFTYEGPTRTGDIDDPSTKVGIASLVFGGAYLFLAGRRDQRGDRRMATPLFAVAIPILHLSVSFLADDLEVAGTAFYAMALGGLAIWLGSRADRRFTSWIGVWGVTGGAVALAAEIADDSITALAVILLVLGLGLAGALFVVEGRDTGTSSAPPPRPTPPSFPGGPPNVVGSAPGGLPFGAPPGVAVAPSPPVDPSPSGTPHPTAPDPTASHPTGPPATGPTWAGPTFTPAPPATGPIEPADGPTNPWGDAPPETPGPHTDPWGQPGGPGR